MAEIGDQPESKGRGWYGVRLKEISDLADRWGGDVDDLKERMAALEEQNRQILALIDPEELEFIWENFREFTEVLSALRRVNGMPPLAEFSGAKARRRKAEAAA